MPLFVPTCLNLNLIKERPAAQFFLHLWDFYRNVLRGGVVRLSIVPVNIEEYIHVL
jgi:hypothetical protein